MQPTSEGHSFLIAAGLVVIGLLGIVVVWKITQSLFKLAFWFLALGVVAAAVWWLLAREGILPPLPQMEPAKPAPAVQTRPA